MRVLSALVVLAGTLLPAACSDATPSEPLPAPSYANVPGPGNPAADAQLQNLNNQLVVCALTNQIDYKRASHIALLTSVLRFTPGTNGNKPEALLGAISNQIEQAVRRDEISPACAAQLNATIAAIEALLNA